MSPVCERNPFATAIRPPCTCGRRGDRGPLRAVIFSQMVDAPSAHPERFPTEKAAVLINKAMIEIPRDAEAWTGLTR